VQLLAQVLGEYRHLFFLRALWVWVAFTSIVILRRVIGGHRQKGDSMENVIENFEGCGPDASATTHDFGRKWQDEYDTQPSESNNFETSDTRSLPENHD